MTTDNRPFDVDLITERVCDLVLGLADTALRLDLAESLTRGPGRVSVLPAGTPWVTDVLVRTSDDATWVNIGRINWRDVMRRPPAELN